MQVLYARLNLAFYIPRDGISALFNFAQETSQECQLIQLGTTCGRHQIVAKQRRLVKKKVNLPKIHTKIKDF